jgi:hypothetical protein
LVEYLNLATRTEITVTLSSWPTPKMVMSRYSSAPRSGAEIAAHKKRSVERGRVWSSETFVADMRDESDQRGSERLHDLLEGLGERRGSRRLMWFGLGPMGGIGFHSYALRYARFQLWINAAGQLMLYGNWNQWQAIKGHPRFAELGQRLGQDHRGPPDSVPVSAVDVDQLWSVALRCAPAINQEEDSHFSPPSKKPAKSAEKSAPDWGINGTQCIHLRGMGWTCRKPGRRRIAQPLRHSERRHKHQLGPCIYG